MTIRSFIPLICALLFILIWSLIVGLIDNYFGFVAYGGPGGYFSIVLAATCYKSYRDPVKFIGFVVLSTLLYSLIFWGTVTTSIFGLMILPGLGAILLFSLMNYVFGYRVNKLIYVLASLLGVLSYFGGMLISTLIDKWGDEPVMQIIFTWWILFGILFSYNQHLGLKEPENTIAPLE